MKNEKNRNSFIKIYRTVTTYDGYIEKIKELVKGEQSEIAKLMPKV